MTDTSQPKPADKVWAMYKGHFAPYGVERDRWYPVRDFGDTFHFLPIFNEDGRQKWASIWQRHVGPTPPDASPASGTKVVGGAIIFDKDAKKWVLETTVASDEWRIHDGSAKRPKGVGKRDRVEVENRGPFGVGRGERLACDAVWDIVTRYRIIERAPKKEKRRKTLLVEYDGAYHPCATMADVDAFQEIHGGTLYTAKLTPVKDTDK